ncbi:MAG: acetyl-CoA acetyltransferase [Phycisphaerales bacterium]|nr:acetyl-CoA acetyltransferase [Hyphomonadaceae bacterium]
MAIDAARIPVIVGVGQVNDRPADPFAGLDSLGLMLEAARAADADAGGGWLKRLDSIAVVDQISFPELGDVSLALAAGLEASPRLCTKTKYPSGASPILLLNEAANRIAAGEIESALIVGGEALRTAAQRKTAQGGGTSSDHEATRRVSTRAEPDYRQRYGLVAPVDVYPLYENAMRAALGQSLAQAQHESAEIWSRMSEVAAGNEAAWIRKAYTTDEIATPSPENRPIAFPYTKLVVANSSVNQGAAFIVTSLAAARRQGVPEERLVYVGYGAAADEAGNILHRDRYDASASMDVSLRRALALSGLESADLDCVELYSCFPCVPKLARRVIGWPAEKPITVFGGLTFGGGPIGNYMSHAVASMTGRLRDGAAHGLLFANGGYATQNHTIVLSRDARLAVREARAFNFQAEADAARLPVPPIDETYVGPARIETYTVFYNRDGQPRSGVVVARTPNGARFLAQVKGDDADTVALLTSGDTEAVGAEGSAVREADLTIWRS